MYGVGVGEACRAAVVCGSVLWQDIGEVEVPVLSLGHPAALTNWHHCWDVRHQRG